LGGLHHAPAALPTGRDSVPIVQVAGWNPAPFWMGMENLALSGFEPRTVQPIPTKLSRLLGRINTIWN